MAARAGHLDVREGEREPRSVVVEELGGSEFLQPVTARAVGVAELAAMGVLVAGGATRLESEEGPIEFDPLGEERRRVGDRRLAMAGAALERRVRTLQRVAGERMVERLLAGFAPVDQLEGAALMLDVAVLALVMIRPGVQASLRHRYASGSARDR